MPDDVILKVEDLHKAFGDNVVLDGVSFELARGDTLVVLGQSGSGKSVLVSCIVGLLEPDQGRVWIVDEEVTTFTKQRQWDAVLSRIGFVFQGAALYDSMTVGENVGFPLHHQTNKSDSEIETIVREKLAMVDLHDVEDKMPSEMSGGMQKRVGLARALALDPELIIYDEPTTGLDPLLAETIGELIRRLQRELGVSSLVITHDMVCARVVADQVAMLYGGKFLAIDTWQGLQAAHHPYVDSYFAAAGLSREGVA